MRLSQLIPAAQIRIGLPATTKREAIDALVALLPLPDDAARAAVVAAVLERESALSTGIGRGVAVPHGKTPAVPRLMAALGTIPAGIPYDAVDGEPCRIFFLLVSDPDSSGPHVRALARVARILNQDRAKQALATATTPEEIQEVFREDERREAR
jgi:mannitol/fructose-specific phosphotransferase system IIA component (Ntr-type)